MRLDPWAYPRLSRRFRPVHCLLKSWIGMFPNRFLNTVFLPFLSPCAVCAVHAHESSRFEGSPSPNSSKWVDFSRFALFFIFTFDPLCPTPTRFDFSSINPIIRCIPCFHILSNEFLSFSSFFSSLKTLRDKPNQSDYNKEE